MCFIALGRWPRAIEHTELFPAPREKYSGLLTAQALNNCILYCYHHFSLNISIIKNTFRAKATFNLHFLKWNLKVSGFSTKVYGFSIAIALKRTLMKMVKYRVIPSDSQIEKRSEHASKKCFFFFVSISPDMHMERVKEEILESLPYILFQSFSLTGLCIY